MVVNLSAYCKQHKEREFILKFSAMEIYNESVRDLLSTDSSPLRLLDDPEVNIIFSFFFVLFGNLSYEVHFPSDRKGQLLRNSQRKLCETGIISRSSFLFAKVKDSLNPVYLNFLISYVL